MLNSMFVCICVGVCARECSCQWRQKEGSKPLGLESQSIVSCLVWVLV